MEYYDYLLDNDYNDEDDTEYEEDYAEDEENLKVRANNLKNELNKKTITDLQKICKENNYRCYSKLRKEGLIELILKNSNLTEEKLSNKKIGDLRRLGSKYKIKNYYNMKKSVLIRLLEEKMREPPQQKEYPEDLKICNSCGIHSKLMNDICLVCDKKPSKHNIKSYRLNRFNKKLLDLKIDNRNKIKPIFEAFINSYSCKYVPYEYLIKKISDHLNIPNSIKIQETKRSLKIWNDFVDKIKNNKI